jgi:hypothetical protein
MIEDNLHKFAPINVVHIAAVGKFLMECEAALQILRSLSFDAHVQIIVQKWTIIRMNAIVDNAMSTLNRRFAAEVSDTVFGDDDLYGMLAVIEVRNHRYERTDLSVLRR